MAIETIKAIQLSAMEGELEEIIKQIRIKTWKMNSHSTPKSWRDDYQKQIIKLIAQKQILENKITESMLLDS